MKRFLWTVALGFGIVAGYAMAAETPKSLVASYDALADVILGAKRAEASLVGAILDGHWHHAKQMAAEKKWEEAAAEMSMFANEGDNAVGGIRKRLLEGGHHHNAEGEAQGLFEPGFVIVTKKAKEGVLAAVAALRGASDDAGREAAWADFDRIAADLLKR
jgi:hypothetical protein